MQHRAYFVVSQLSSCKESCPTVSSSIISNCILSYCTATYHLYSVGGGKRNWNISGMIQTSDINAGMRLRSHTDGKGFPFHDSSVFMLTVLPNRKKTGSAICLSMITFADSQPSVLRQRETLSYDVIAQYSQKRRPGWLSAPIFSNLTHIGLGPFWWHEMEQR